MRIGMETLSLYKLGLTKEESSPTVVTFDNPFTIADWSDLALQVKQLLPAINPIAAHIGVEIFPGSVY